MVVGESQFSHISSDSHMCPTNTHPHSHMCLHTFAHIHIPLHTCTPYMHIHMCTHTHHTRHGPHTCPAPDSFSPSVQWTMDGGDCHPRREPGAQASVLGGPVVSCPAAQLSLHPTLDQPAPDWPVHIPKSREACLRVWGLSGPLGATHKRSESAGASTSAQGGSVFSGDEHTARESVDPRVSVSGTQQAPNKCLRLQPDFLKRPAT